MIILALVFAAVTSYDLLFFRGGGGKPGPLARPASTKEERPEAMPGLKLSLLDRPRPAYRGAARDIFAPIREEVKTPVAKAIAPPAPPPPPQAVLPPPPSRLKIFASEVKFLGLLEKKDGKTAFLSKGNDVYIVKKGDLIESFRITELNGFFMALIDEESREEVRVIFRKEAL